MQCSSGHCIRCGWTSCCCVPPSPKKTACEVELLVQAPDTPPTLHSGGSHSFPRSFSEILSLALAPLAFFIITAPLKIRVSFSFFSVKYSPLAISYPNIIVEASKEKYLLQEILQKWKKRLEGPHGGCRNSTDSNWGSSLGHFPQSHS